MSLGNLLRNPKPESESFIIYARGRTLKLFENSFDVARRQANPLVSYADDRFVANDRDGDLDGLPLTIFYGIR